MDLKYVQCPYCLKPFQDGDDVVVCPECGTPAHRACWKQNGHCLYENKHASGFVWEIPYSKEREEAEQKAREEEAARKRAQTFGAGQGGRDTRPDGMPFDNEYGNYASYTTGDHGEMKPTMRVIGPDEMLGDFRVREYGDLIQKNKNKYIPKFFIMDRTKRNFVGNFAAFLAPTLWSAYRRMYGLAILLVILQFIVPLIALDSVVEYYSEGVSLARQYVLTDASDQEAAEEAMAALMEKMPQPPVALQINHYIIMAIHLLMGMFANTIYKRRCEQLLTKAKTIENADERALFLKRRGGTSVIAAVLFAAILYTLLNLIVSIGTQRGYGQQEVAEATTKAAEAATKAVKNAQEVLIALWRK
ncbi:MAG: hypothetical protein IJG86_10880 [Clostridia bacterium]|nr:hypothetical protein [Clostridia bacterium]